MFIIIKITNIYFLLFILINFFINKINLSNGDISPYFNYCIFKCKDLFNCPEFKYSQFTWWANEKCFKCRQKCIWNTVEHFRISKKQIPKFNGKWPFTPIKIKIGNIYLANIQEPASTFFSLLNAFSFWKMKQKIKRKIKNNWKHLNKWVGFGNIGIITWIASITFHICDHWITEIFDYCAAFTLILYTFYISVCFCFSEYFEEKQNIFLSIGFISFYFGYLTKIYSKPLFNYSFHMKCCILIGLLTGFIFLFWIFFEYLYLYIKNPDTSPFLAVKFLSKIPPAEGRRLEFFEWYISPTTFYALFRKNLTSALKRLFALKRPWVVFQMEIARRGEVESKNACWEDFKLGCVLYRRKNLGGLGSTLRPVASWKNCTSRPKMTHGVRRKSPTIYNLYANRKSSMWGV